jgi:hypothetical protein
MAKVVTFVTHITLKNGRVIYAKDYGKRAFPIVMDSEEKDKTDSEKSE